MTTKKKNLKKIKKSGSINSDPETVVVVAENEKKIQKFSL